MGNHVFYSLKPMISKKYGHKRNLKTILFNNIGIMNNDNEWKYCVRAGYVI